MNFGVVGAAHGHIYEFIEEMISEGAKFVGVYNDHSGISEEIAEKYQVPLFSELRDLLDSNVEIVGTSAINSEKINYIEACCERGVHIIADKPIVVNEEQFKRLEKVIQCGNIQVGMMFTLRFWPEIYTTKKMIQENIIGDIINMEILTPHRLRAENRPEWFFEKEKNGGVVIDLLIHSIDLFRWVTGSEITDFTGMVQKTILPEKETFFDCAEFLVKSLNGTNGYMRTDWHMTDSHWSWGDMRVFFVGTRGNMEVRAIGDPITRQPMVILYKEGKETVQIGMESYKKSCTKDFLDRIHGMDYVISHEDILQASRLAIEFDKKAQRIRREQKV